MSRVSATIEVIYLENDSATGDFRRYGGRGFTCDFRHDGGSEVESVRATCSRCGHTTESYGTDEPSKKRCLVLLREECPLGQNNFYAETALPATERGWR